MASKTPAEGLPEQDRSGPTDPQDRSRRLRGSEALRLHFTLVAGLALCVAAFVFEISRALGGNTLSWAYVFEWPIFAVFALYMWWNLLHGQDGSRSKRRTRTPAAVTDPSGAAASAADASDGADLLAWQAYLAGMEAEEARQSDRPSPD